MIFLLLYAMTVFGQEKQDIDVLDTGTIWTKELFTFPLHFAKEIPYKGIEDARFPIGWGNKESPEFWSYAFAWHIALTTMPMETELEESLQIYFDGLMKGVNKDKDLIIPKTRALLLKKGNPDSISMYVGEVIIFDAFRTKKPMILNVLVESYHCKENKKSVVLFRFSPKPFEHPIWKKLKKVSLHTDICDL